MTGFIRCMGLRVAVLLLGAAGAASAQENLNAGKTPAELYVSDCAICHKSPRGLADKAGFFGLGSFLREHYTSSRESAAAITAYLQAIDREPAHRQVRSKSSSKTEHKAKLALPPPRPSEAKSSESKSSETKASKVKASKTKSSESKSSETKSSLTKSGKTQSSESKPSGSKPSASKPSPAAQEQAKAVSPKTHKAKSQAKQDETKAEASKAGAAKPATDDKDAKPEKSD
jgi:DNA polymerase III gamma/tau subunit